LGWTNNEIKTPVDKPMIDGVQVYLNAVRSRHPDLVLGRNCYVELEFHCPDIHEYCWGKADFVYTNDYKTLHVWDFKNGVMDVEIIENAQLMYYGAAVLEWLELCKEDDIYWVVLHVVQPNGFSSDGPVREWVISADDLWYWMNETMIPAMDKALASRDTASGEHCRFCPARARACPQIIDDMYELEEIIGRWVVPTSNQINDWGKIMEMLKKTDAAPELTDDQCGYFKDLFDVAKIACKAVDDTVFGRMMAGKMIPGRKLVKAKSNREWKIGADIALMNTFGEKALMPRILKSPPQVEKLVGGEKMTARYAFKPDKGLTVARADDKRMAVDRDPAKGFKDQTKKGTTR
jgi:hypothetical protein